MTQIKSEETKDDNGLSWNEEVLMHLKSIVTPDKLNTLTSKKVREELERSLNLPAESLDSKKTEINEILNTLILEMNEENKDIKNYIKEPEKDNEVELTNQNEHKIESKLANSNEKISTKRKQASMMSIEEFLEKAEVLNLKINNSKSEITISPRQFSTGSVGWYFGDKIPLPIGDDVEVICQVSINCTVVGSKNWPQKLTKKLKK